MIKSKDSLRPDNALRHRRIYRRFVLTGILSLIVGLSGFGALYWCAHKSRDIRRQINSELSAASAAGSVVPDARLAELNQQADRWGVWGQRGSFGCMVSMWVLQLLGIALASRAYRAESR